MGQSKSIVRSKSIAGRKLVGRNNCLVESLENRVLLSVATGAAAVNEGEPYLLSLPQAQTGVTGYSIDWGDGATSQVAATAASAKHTYADGPGAAQIAVSALSSAGAKPLGVKIASGKASAMLDDTFGQYSPTNLPQETRNDPTIQIAELPDGKFITAEPSNPNIVLKRFLANGQPDLTFGTNGRVTTFDAPFASQFGYYDVPAIEAAPTGDGKFYLLTNTSYTNDPSFLARFNADGTLDTSFSGGRVNLGVTSFQNGFYLNDFAFTPDGKIVVVGREPVLSNDDYPTRAVCYQLNSDGTPDMQFGTSGVARFESTGVGLIPISVAVDGAGRILFSGSGSGGSFCLRLNAGGQLDTTFGDSGIAMSIANFYPSAIVVSPNGRILVGGTQYNLDNNNGTGADEVITQLTDSGAIDSSFNGGLGLNLKDFGRSNEYLTDMILQKDGGILAVGSGTSKYVGTLWRLNADGSNDTTFGPAGSALMDYGLTGLYPMDSILLDDGSLIMGESVYVEGAANGFHSFINKYLPQSLVTISNAAPTATFTNDGAVKVGTASIIRFNNATDASAADVAAGFKYSYDFNNDGDFADAGEIADSTSASKATHVFPSAGTYTVHGRIADKDGGYRDYTTTVVVNSDVPPPVTETIQAEDAVLSGGTGKSTQWPGFNGSGFADYGDSGSAAQFSVTRAAAGSAKLEFRYALGATVARPLTIYVNGNNIGTVTFTPTGAWDQWGTVSLTTNLNGGVNTVLAVAGIAGGPNLDQLTVSDAGTLPPPPPPSGPYQAEDATLHDVTAQTTNGGFLGTAYADYGGDGSYTEFVINQTADAHVLLNFRYANGTPSARPLTILNDGGVVGTLDFAPTGSWTTWTTTSINAVLHAGQNVIRVRAGSAGGPNLDQMTISPDDTPPPPDSITYQAEDMTFGDASIQSTNGGYKGTGYVDVNGQGSYVMFTFDRTAGGDQKLEFRYANGTSTARPMTITIDGASFFVLEGKPTGSWTNWTTQSVVFPLRAGVNEVRLTTNGDGGPNIDQLVVSNPDDAPPPISTVYDAESASLQGVTVETTNGGYLGSGYVDYGGTGSYAQFTVHQSAGGQAKLEFRYANGQSPDRPLTVFINGVATGTINFPATGAWTNWSTATLTAALNAGDNLIRLVAGPAGGPNIDQLTVTPLV